MSASNAEDCAPAPPAKLLAPGEMVDGRYRIEAYLGGGGMASVYRAMHVVLEQEVAIKVISAHIREVPGMAQRFLREARAATHLKSEHVARVSDVGTMADGAPYMVMEYLEGTDLDALVESSDVLSVDDCVDFVLQACEAIAEVHGHGIVHRDLKPANLFLTTGADGLPCVKLIDFGISRTDSPLSPKDAAGLTLPDTVMGSPRYMSPEQMECATKADSRSDIYGIGAVLYELLTKKAPHEGDTFLDIYAAATLGPPVAPSALRGDVPTAMDAVILRCLEIAPDARYPDIAALAVALAPFGPEGSFARADAIGRILDAARLRTREATTDEHPAAAEGSRASSKIRRRASSSGPAARRKRVFYGLILGGAAALAGIVFGGRALYSQGHATGMASASAPLAAAVTPAIVPPTPAALAVPPSVIEPARIGQGNAPPGMIEIRADDEPAPRGADSLANPRKIDKVTPRAPAARPAPVARPAPMPAAPVATSEERTLFEDRK